MEKSQLPSLVRENALILVLFAAGLVFLVIGLIQFATPAKPPLTVTTVPQVKASHDSRQILVDVSGAVQAPGVYRLAESARIEDALAKAGGLRQDADISFVSQSINRAAKLVDGQKIYIPPKGSQQSNSQTGSSQSSMVNINSATLTDLDKLPGVGQVTAQKIVDQRPYSTTEELKTKKVVSESVFDKIKDRVSVY